MSFISTLAFFRILKSNKKHPFVGIPKKTLKKLDPLRNKFQLTTLTFDEINPGQWFAKKLKSELKADKVLVQKSGYFSRSAVPNNKDLELIKVSGKLGAELALEGQSGVIGMDDDKNCELSLIDFERVKGGKPFDYTVSWFNKLLTDIGQK